jgi:outer membrane immunogenic protein
MAMACLALAGTFTARGADELGAGQKRDAVEPSTGQKRDSFDWNGFYIGGNLGASWANYDFGGYNSKVDVTQQFLQLEGEVGNNTDGPQPSGEVQADTFNFFHFPGTNHGAGGTDVSPTGGVQVGWQKQFGHFVLGAETAFNGMDNGTGWTMQRAGAESDFFFGNVFGDSTYTTMRRAQTNYTGALMGKLGFAWDQWLFYAIGGALFTDNTTYAQDHVSTDFFAGIGDGANGGQRFIGTQVNKFSAEDENILFGSTVGGGFEYAVTQICTMGVEFRHNWSGDHNYHFADNHGPVFPGNTNVELNTNQVTFKVNFYLGHLGH